MIYPTSHVSAAASPVALNSTAISCFRRPLARLPGDGERALDAAPVPSMPARDSARSCRPARTRTMPSRRCRLARHASSSGPGTGSVHASPVTALALHLYLYQGQLYLPCHRDAALESQPLTSRWMGSKGCRGGGGQSLSTSPSQPELQDQSPHLPALHRDDRRPYTNILSPQHHQPQRSLAGDVPPPDSTAKMLPLHENQSKYLIARPASGFGVSIDKVLETAQAQPDLEERSRRIVPPEQSYAHQHLYATPHTVRPDRPGFFRPPSRIGLKQLDRPAAPRVAAMRIPVTVGYASPGLKPPVYIFTDLSDPQWEAVEMETAQDVHGAYRFHKTFQVEAGEYQYKFRLGPGEWWTLDSSRPTIDDGLGNKNNSVQVLEMAHPAAAKQASEHAQQDPTSVHADEHTQSPLLNRAEDGNGRAMDGAVINASSRHGATLSDDHAAAPLMKHEVHEEQQPTKVASTDLEPRPSGHESADRYSFSDKCSGAPLMRHETSTMEPRSQPLEHGNPQTDDHKGSRVSEDAPSLMQHEVSDPQPLEPIAAAAVELSDDNYDGDDDSEDEGPPLLSHERTTSSSTDLSYSPLPRRQSASSGNNLGSGSSSSPHIRMPIEPPVASQLFPLDLDDPSLERFPTDEKGILEHIRRTSMNLPKDETTEERLSPVSTTNLPSVIEEDDADDDDSQFGQIRGIGGREAPFEADTRSVDPGPILPDDDRPANPMTPPLTPKELESEVEELEREESVAQDVQEIDADEAAEQQELVELEAMAARSWWQKALDVATHPITWLVAIGLAYAVPIGYARLHLADAVRA
nr:hypothetical protein CFP56_24590 [Quercus suber]